VRLDVDVRQLDHLYPLAGAGRWAPTMVAIKVAKRAATYTYLD
jgi:hypothetical protein